MESSLRLEDQASSLQNPPQLKNRGDDGTGGGGYWHHIPNINSGNERYAFSLSFSALRIAIRHREVHLVTQGICWFQLPHQGLARISSKWWRGKDHKKIPNVWLPFFELKKNIWSDSNENSQSCEHLTPLGKCSVSAKSDLEPFDRKVTTLARGLT